MLGTRRGRIWVNGKSLKKLDHMLYMREVWVKSLAPHAPEHGQYNPEPSQVWRLVMWNSQSNTSLIIVFEKGIFLRTEEEAPEIDNPVELFQFRDPFLNLLLSRIITLKARRHRRQNNYWPEVAKCDLMLHAWVWGHCA